MNRTGRCPKCDSKRLLYVSQVADSHDHAAVGGFQQARLAYVPEPGPLGIGVIGRGFGALEAGVCRACGFVELYVKDPESIPVDGTHVRPLGSG